MIFLDTNILAYCIGREHPLKQPCRRLVEYIEAGRLEATTTPEVIQEFVHIRARSRGRGDAARLASEFVDLLEPLVTSDQADLEAGLRLFVRYPGLNAFDAVLAATAIQHKVRTLVSADGAFASVPGLHHVHPSAVDELIDQS